MRYSGMEAALSIWWYEGGREQEKQTRPCLRAELEAGESSTLRRDGILGPAAFMFRCLFLLAA